MRIYDCRIYDSGIGIDIELDLRIGKESDKDIRPPGSSRFTLIENREIYNNEKTLSVGMRYSQVRAQGCFIDNQRKEQQPVILVPIPSDRPRPGPFHDTHPTQFG
jgi:hypothetical protein